jgi:hypothetical protein
MTMGGLGIAYYRLLYVKASNWVKYSIGDKQLLAAIGLGGLILSSFFTFVFSSGKGNRANLNLCKGQYVIQVKNILY